MSDDRDIGIGTCGAFDRIYVTDITYVDPSTGESYTVGMSEMENMTEAGGNTFIGYIR